jgi:hypothetical protein
MVPDPLSVTGAEPYTADRTSIRDDLEETPALGHEVELALGVFAETCDATLVQQRPVELIGRLTVLIAKAPHKAIAKIRIES